MKTFKAGGTVCSLNSVPESCNLVCLKREGKSSNILEIYPTDLCQNLFGCNVNILSTLKQNIDCGDHTEENV